MRGFVGGDSQGDFCQNIAFVALETSFLPSSNFADIDVIKLCGAFLENGVNQQVQRVFPR